MPKSEISWRYGARFRRGKYSISSQFEFAVLLLVDALRLMIMIDGFRCIRYVCICRISFFSVDGFELSDERTMSNT